MVKKEDIGNLGMVADHTVRTCDTRIDDAARQDKVLKARNLIYKDGYVVNSEHVEALLKDQSLVPTIVRACSYKQADYC